MRRSPPPLSLIALVPALGLGMGVGMGMGMGVTGACGQGKPTVHTDKGNGRDAAASVDVKVDVRSGVNVIPVTVIPINMGRPSVAGDGLCDLDEALAAVNAGPARGAVSGGDCGAATGNDAIALPAGTFVLTTPLAPAVSVEIHGAGMGATAIAIAFALPDDSGGPSPRCGVHVAVPGARLALEGLTLRPAASTGPGAANLTGACVAAGTLRVRHTRVTGFTAGGVRVQAPAGGAAKLELYNALVDGNRNPGDGGGIAVIGKESWLSVDQSAIVNNVSGGMGGGLWVAGGSNANYVYNTTFSGNTAWRGGGVAARVLAQTYFGLYWSTVARNRALDVAGGLHIEGESLDAHGTSTGSIIAENTADADTAQANLNAEPAPGFSCTSSLLLVAALPNPPLNILGSCRYDVADADGQVGVGLGPLMDMGGVDHLPVHPLLPGSPAIDATAERRLEDVIEQRDGWNGVAGDRPFGGAAGDTPVWTSWAADKADNPLSDMGAYEYNPHWETELLSVVEVSRGRHDITPLDQLSHGAGTRLVPEAAKAFVVYQVPVPEAGAHDVTVRAAVGPTGGAFRLLVADLWSGPYRDVGTAQWTRAAAVGAQTFALGTVSFAGPGQKFFQFVSLPGPDGDAGDQGAKGPTREVVLDFLTVRRP